MDWTAMIKDMSPRQGAELNNEVNKIFLNWCMAVKPFVDRAHIYGSPSVPDYHLQSWKFYSDFVSKCKV